MNPKPVRRLVSVSSFIHTNMFIMFLLVFLKIDNIEKKFAKVCVFGLFVCTSLYRIWQESKLLLADCLSNS